MRLPAIRRQTSVKTADDFLTDTKIHNAEGPFTQGSPYRPAGFQLETNLSSYRKARRLELFEILEGQSRANEVRRYRLVRVAVVRRTRDNSCTPSAFSSWREKPQLRIGYARFVPRNT